MEATCNDNFLLIPNKKAPLMTYFSFEIVKSKEAIALKELAKDKADLPPFKEWIERFSDSNIKKGLEIDNFKSSIRTPKLEKGIDREYFQEMMALVGRSVETQLKILFKGITSQPNNACLRIEVIWNRKADKLISNSSCFRDKGIDVKIWVEEHEKKQQKNDWQTMVPMLVAVIIPFFINLGIGYILSTNDPRKT